MPAHPGLLTAEVVVKGFVLILLSLSLAPLVPAQSPPPIDTTRVAALVPADLSPTDACNGFSDLTACSAALHVSQNLNIPFMELKYRVIAGQSLAAAIHSIEPAIDSRHEAERAERQARADRATHHG